MNKNINLLSTILLILVIGSGAPFANIKAEPIQYNFNDPNGTSNRVRRESMEGLGIACSGGLDVNGNLCQTRDRPVQDMDGLGMGERNRVGPEEARSSPNSTCDTDFASAKSRCKSAGYAQYGGMAAGVVSQFQSAQSSGNIKEACESAAKINGLVGAANAGFAVACKMAVNKCKASCIGENNGYDEASGEYMSTQCERFGAIGDASTMQAAQSAIAFAGSQACIDASSGKCIGDNAYNDEECQQFCVKPGRQDHPKCRIAMNNCNDSQYASQNAQYCNCIRNPFSPQCGTNLGGLPTSALNGAPPLQDLEIPPGAYDYEGNNIQGSRSDFGGANGGGSGFNGSGGGSSALGGNETQGNGDDPIDKNILSGASGGGGMVGGFGGGGYNEGGGGGNKAGGSKDPDGIDLKAFLPGGKKDPKRAPASAYGDASITPANGLTNFQKVTKKFLEKIQNGELRP